MTHNEELSQRYGAALAVDPWHIGDRVIYRLTDPGYSAPFIRGTIVEDCRGMAPTGRLDDPGPGLEKWGLGVRVDTPAIWQGEPAAADRPRDFLRGHIIFTTGDRLEHDELAVLGRAWRDAQVAAAALLDPARDELRAAVVRAVSAGLSEEEIARRVRTTRQTIRDLQGKPRSRRSRRKGGA